MEYEFTASVDKWDGGAGWFFVRLPKDTYDEIKEIASIAGSKRGFGAVKVEVSIGSSTWLTSVFPDSEDKTYILFIKKQIRTAQKIVLGDEVELHVHLQM